MLTDAIGPLILAALVGVLSVQGAIWYKLGKVESKVEAHLHAHTRGLLTDGDSDD